MFSMYFHRFPTFYQSIEINIRKTYGVSTTGHKQKFEKAYVVLISIPQVKNHGIAHLPLDDPCLYPPLCDPLPIISTLIILIACDWFICHTYLSVGINPCMCLPQLENQLVHMFRLQINTITVSVISIQFMIRWWVK